MPLLQVDLQEGFDRDHVVISINGETVLDEPNVSTRMQIGVARTIRHEVDAGGTSVQVLVTSRSAQWSEDRQITEPTFLGLTLTADDTLLAEWSTAPFRYL